MICINDIKQDEYNDYLIKHKHASFLQSWEWGVFRQSIGNEVFRLGIREDDKIVWASTLLKIKICPNFYYLYCPRVLSKNIKPEIIEFFLQEIKKQDFFKNVVFLRFEPDAEMPVFDKKIVLKKTIALQPVKTLLLDIGKNEDELLVGMHQKTRYNIRLAQKKGVEIVKVDIDNDPASFESFWALMQETKKRDGFKIHQKDYYQKMLKKLAKAQGSENNKNMFVKFYLAKYQEKFITSALVAFFGDTATYMHGASGNEFRNVMAPYFLQWRVIKEAKKYNCRYYDFFGIDEEKWPGVTRFKIGFSGEIFEYPGVYDIIFNKTYYHFYELLRIIRRFF